MKKRLEFLPEEFAVQPSLQHVLLDIIGELPRTQREALVLYYYGDMDCTQIAWTMCSSAARISVCLFTAMRTIKKRLQIRLNHSVKSAKRFSCAPVLTRVYHLDTLRTLPEEKEQRMCAKLAAQIDARFPQDVAEAKPAKGKAPRPASFWVKTAIAAVAFVACALFGHIQLQSLSDMTVVIQDQAIPLAAAPASRVSAWSLADLMLAVTGAALAAATLIIGLILRIRRPIRAVWLAATTALAAVGTTVFMLTQDTGGTQVILDYWTMPMALLVIAQVLCAVMLFKGKPARH